MQKRAPAGFSVPQEGQAVMGAAPRPVLAAAACSSTERSTSVRIRPPTSIVAPSYGGYQNALMRRSVSSGGSSGPTRRSASNSSRVT